MAFTYFKEVFQVKEAELQSILANNPTIIEDGLTVLKQEYPTDEGLIDLLCVDDDGRLTVSSLK
jgi:RecB family endonuclease NucS